MSIYPKQDINNLDELIRSLSVIKEQIMRITAIYDNGGETIDRYTVVTDVIEKQDHHHTYYMALGLSTGGVAYNEWGAALPGKHLGRQIHIEDLDEATQWQIFKRVFDEA